MNFNSILLAKVMGVIWHKSYNACYEEMKSKELCKQPIAQKLTNNAAKTYIFSCVNCRKSQSAH